LRQGQPTGRTARETIDFDTAQPTTTRIDEYSSLVITFAHQEVAKNVDTRCRFGTSLDREFDAGASTRTSPRRHFCHFKLARVPLGVFRSMLNHPSSKLKLGICERPIVLCGHVQIRRNV
jgi:hypothetical protein